MKTLSDTSLTKEEKEEAIEKIALENVDIKALGLLYSWKYKKQS